MGPPSGFFNDFPCIHNYFEIGSLKSQEGLVYPSCWFCSMGKITEKLTLVFLSASRFFSANSKRNPRVEYRTEAVLSVAQMGIIPK